MIIRKTRPEEGKRVNTLFAIAFEQPMENGPGEEPGVTNWGAFEGETMFSTFAVTDFTQFFDGNQVKMGGIGGVATLPRNEQVPGETYTEGETLQVYVVDVVSGERGARVMISRTHPGLVKRLFELEVPEIYDGTVEVKAISREAGARTKMAVWSKDPNVNPVSACIGPHGDRVAAVVEKLGGEKIDIVKWSEDVSEFISAALSPAKVLKVELLPGETRSCRVTVPDQQLSLAIGNKGQNARLCARLTGYNIDIRPESGYYGEEETKTEETAE